MPENPYQPPKEVNETLMPAPAQLPWAMAGLVAGLAAGPLLTVILTAEMHEYYDPPLTEEFARAWPATVVLSGITAVLGSLFGALARNLLFWRRQR